MDESHILFVTPVDVIFRYPIRDFRLLLRPASYTLISSAVPSHIILIFRCY